MKKLVVWSLLAVCAAPRLAPAQDAKVEVTQVSVGKKLTDAQKDLFFGNAAGTKLMLLISLPGRTFIGAEREESVFKSFKDDKGTELFAPLGHAPETDDWLGAFGPKFTDDGKMCGLSVEAPGLPAKDATKLSFAGDLVLRCGATPKTVEQKNVALKKGAKITVGPVPMTVTSAAVAGNQTNFDLHARAPLDRIVSIRFFDSTGKQIAGGQRGYESGSIMGNYEITTSYELQRKVTAVNVKITYFEKVEKVTVPVQIEAGLGL